jgi:hypothetical protein
VGAGTFDDETPGRLVPDADPVEALVCRYPLLGEDLLGEDPAELAGGPLLAGDRTTIRIDLACPSSCRARNRAARRSAVRTCDYARPGAATPEVTTRPSPLVAHVAGTTPPWWRGSREGTGC